MPRRAEKELAMKNQRTSTQSWNGQKNNGNENGNSKKQGDGTMKTSTQNQVRDGGNRAGMSVDANKEVETLLRQARGAAVKARHDEGEYDRMQELIRRAIGWARKSGRNIREEVKKIRDSVPSRSRLEISPEMQVRLEQMAERSAVQQAALAVA